MIKLEIQGETRLFSYPEDLYACLGQICGRDVEDYLKQMDNSSSCSGECDETYRIEEHYQRMIRDFVDELEILLKSKHIDRLKLQKLQHDLWKGL